MRLHFSIACLLAVVSLSVTVNGQQPQLCKEWHECRQLALDAAARGEYELFHDLAWRTVQTGPRNDPELMFLLARAQALSNRPHDALVMLQRLSDKGVAAAAITDPEFARTRELPSWPELEAALAAGVSVPPPAPITAVAAATPSPKPAPAPLPKPAAAPPPKPIAAASPEPVAVPAPEPAATPLPEPAAVASSESALATSDAAHFSAQRFRPAGLAFDAVSQRFVIGDALGRKLIVVGIGPGHADDMVRAESAGFDDVAALDIDKQRGDLWVVSAAESSGTSSVHRLQLVSGRPLKTYPVPSSMGPSRLVDLAVQPSGGVVALDAAGNRLVMLARGAAEVVAGLPLDLSGTTSIANAGNENIIYVAHDKGISRVDLKARTVAALSVPKGLELTGFDSIRAHRDSLVGLQTSSGGQRQLVRLKLNAAGRGVREASVIDRSIAEEGRVILNITGDELYYMAIAAAPSGAPADTGDRTEAVPFVIRHLTLR